MGEQRLRWLQEASDRPSQCRYPKRMRRWILSLNYLCQKWGQVHLQANLLSVIDEDETPPYGWTVQDLHLAPEYIAALAYHDNPNSTPVPVTIVNDFRLEQGFDVVNVR
jgi:hypothetical protein